MGRPNQVELISDGAAFVANDVLGVASRGSEYYTRDDQGEVLAKRSGASNSWYLHDRIGSVVGLTDASGAGSGGYTYDPYGNPLGTAPNIPWGYAGGYAGPWGGLYRFGFRYYDPTVGRWTQQDPADPNSYTYVGDSPIDQTDPMGLWGKRELHCATLGLFSDHCASPGELWEDHQRRARNWRWIRTALKFTSGCVGLGHTAREVATRGVLKKAAGPVGCLVGGWAETKK